MVQHDHKLLSWVIAIVLVIGIHSSSSASLPDTTKVKKVVPAEITEIAEFAQMRNSKLAPEIAIVIAEAIYSASKRRAVPVELLVGIVEQESLYNPFEVSSAGAKGLMQILVGDVEIDPDKAHGIRYNIDIGTTILYEKIQKNKGDLMAALAAYSGGAKGYEQAVLTNMGRFMLFRKSKRGGGG